MCIRDRPLGFLPCRPISVEFGDLEGHPVDGRTRHVADAARGTQVLDQLVAQRASEFALEVWIRGERSDKLDVAVFVHNVALDPHRGNRKQRRTPVSYTHLRAHETVLDLVCRLLLEKKK